jgi:alanine racemase
MTRFKKEKTWIELSRKNLRRNLEVFRRLCGRATPIWIVKADAYGHGAGLIAPEIVKTIKKGRGEWFGVDSVDEAVFLRKEGIKEPIIVLGYVPTERLTDLGKYDLRLLISSFGAVKCLARLKIMLRVHLKIDTGTSRQGVFPDDALRLARAAKAAGLIVEGCATHFANIEDTTNPTYADLQIERFIQVVAALKRNGFAIPMVHAACTAAVLTRKETVFSAVRVGIGLYGIYPSPLVKKIIRKKLKLYPVLSWKTRVALVKHLPTDTPVGYGLTEKTQKKTVLAVIPVGYADGMPRAASGKGRVIINDKKCRIIGRICMNIFMVDAGSSAPRENDIVTIIGSANGITVSADDLAEAANAISYEVVARLPLHIKRIVV